MKKFFLLALIFVMLVSGCGSKYSNELLLKENASWVETKENIDDFMDAAGRGNNNEYDEEFLMQQFLDGKIKSTDKEIKISVTDELKGGKVVEIKFLQGRNKNKVGYTFPEFVIDVGKERELEKKRNAEKKAAEEKKFADEKARLEKLADAEKEQFKKLAEQNPRSSDVAQITCTMSDGTSAYQKLIGKANLPEGTRLKITIANVNKESTVQQDGIFSALFERAIIPVGEQNISIMTLDRNSQPLNAQSVDEMLIKDKGVGFLGRELYAGKISIQ